MNLNDFMKSNGFLNYDGSGAKYYEPEYLYKMLHDNDPIKMLKIYEFFVDKELHSTDLKYLDDYIIDPNEGCSCYYQEHFLLTLILVVTMT